MRTRQTIDMTPSGEIRSIRPAIPLAWKLGGAALIAAFAAGAVAGAILLVWLSSVLIPLVLVVALGSAAALRVQSWRARRALTRGRTVVRQ